MMRLTVGRIVIDFLRLIRWHNLAIIVLAMVVLRYFLIDSLLGAMELKTLTGETVAASLKLPLADFILMLASTVMLAAGGYVINDYFDIKTDLITRGDIIVGKTIPRRRAMMLHNILNLIAVSAGFFLSWRVGHTSLGILFLVVSGLLYFYSSTYKRQLLTGNIVVALLIAAVPMIVVIYEIAALSAFYSINTIEQPDYNLLLIWCAGFSLFAFLTSLIREIIKDIKGHKGDFAHNRHTLPVVAGVKSSRYVVATLSLLTVAALYLAWWFYITDLYTLGYITVALAIPLASVSVMMVIGRGEGYLRIAGRLMKAVMFAGILYTAVVKIILSYLF